MNLTKVISWPASPHENQFIEQICNMLNSAGADVKSGDLVRGCEWLSAPDIYIFHWPDAIFHYRTGVMHWRLWSRVVRVLFNLIMMRTYGARIIWFVHNLEPHDLPNSKRSVWQAYTTVLSWLVDAWVTLSPSTYSEAVARYPRLSRKHHTYIWHPPYKRVYEGTKSDARYELGLSEDSLIIGHVGLIRRYKNLVESAQQILSVLKDDELLVIKGKSEKLLIEQLSSFTPARGHYIFSDGNLSAAAYDRELVAMDVFIAPYESFLHSGAIVHALSRGCVIIAPRVPFTVDLKEKLGGDWMTLYKDNLDESIIAGAFEAAKKNRAEMPDLAFLEPKKNIDRMKNLLNFLLS